MITDFHAKYLAHELTKRSASDSVEKLAAARIAPARAGRRGIAAEQPRRFTESVAEAGSIPPREIEHLRARVVVEQRTAGGKDHALSERVKRGHNDRQTCCRDDQNTHCMRA